MNAIAKGQASAESLLGKFKTGSSKTGRAIPEAVRKAEEFLAVNRMVSDAKVRLNCAGDKQSRFAENSTSRFSGTTERSCILRAIIKQFYC